MSNAHRTQRHRGASARALARALACGGAFALSAGCGGNQAPTLYPITLRVVSDSRPLAGAQVLVRDRELGATDATGSFRMQTPGVEGTSLELTVRCPNGFTSPANPVSVVLRSTIALDRTQQAAGIETTAECPPSHRIAAVVVRTPNRGNLPILYNGHEITRTDLQGIAHMIFRVAPREAIALRIDTSSQPNLRPQNPLLTVTTREGDDVYVTSQNFDDYVPPVVRRPVVRRGPVIQRVPTRARWPF